MDTGKVTQNEDGSVTVELQYPISGSGRAVTHFIIRRAKLGHLQQVEMSPGSASTTLGMLEQLTDLQQEAAIEIDAVDAERITGALAGLTGKTRPEGWTFKPPVAVKQNGDGSVTVGLQYPIMNLEVEPAREVTSLTVRRARLGHLRKTESIRGDASVMLAMLEGVTDFKQRTLKGLDALDVEEIAVVLAGLLGKSLRTGGTSGAT